MEFNEIGQPTGAMMGEKSRGSYAYDRTGMLMFKIIRGMHKLECVDQLDQEGLAELEEYLAVFIRKNCQ